MNEYGEKQLREDTQKRVVDKYKWSFMKCSERIDDQARKDMHKIRSPTLGDGDNRCLRSGYLEEWAMHTEF
jgi:hypothetical protein